MPLRSPVSVTVVDDSDLAQAGVRALLAPFADHITVVDNAAALAAPQDLDVVLFEPYTRSSLALGIMRDLQARGTAAVAAYSWSDSPTLSSTMPVLSKCLTAAQLASHVRCLARGGVVSQGASDRVSGATGSGPSYRKSPATDLLDRREQAVAALTQREHEMLERVARGDTNSEIAAQLDLSVNTVKTYVRSAYRKIGATRRSQAVRWALIHGLGNAEVDISQHRPGALSH